MFKSLLYKEWLKTRVVLCCLVIVLVAFTSYDFLALSKNASIMGYGFLWGYAVGKNSILVENLIYLPLICGVFLALAQYVPESYHKCLKLTLHLPERQSVIVAIMQGYGICVMAIIFLLQGISLVLFLGHYLVWDVVWRIAFSFLTWYCAGMCIYIWLSAICLEPSWKMKLFEVFLMVAVSSVFYLSTQSMAYKHAIFPIFMITTIGGCFLIYYSVKRFKDGVQ